MRWQRRLAVLVMLGVGLAALVARAESPDDLAAEGIRLRRAGRDPDALPLFRRALEQNTTPKAYAQLGLCEQAVGLWAEAERHLEQALRSGQDGWIAKNETVLREALGVVQARLGSIEIWGEPKGAVLSIDGRGVGTLPMERPARATGGQHAVRVEADGFLPVTRTVEITPGKLSREHVTLVPVAAVAAIDPAAAVGAGPPAAGTDPAPIAEASAAQGSMNRAVDAGDPFYSRWWFWALVGAVAVAGGIATYVLTRDDSCSPPPGGGTCEGWK
jgi:hypothetical protein